MDIREELIEKVVEVQLKRCPTPNKCRDNTCSQCYADSILTLFKEYVKGIKNPLDDGDGLVTSAQEEGFNRAIQKAIEEIRK